MANTAILRVLMEMAGKVGADNKVVKFLHGKIFFCVSAEYKFDSHACTQRVNKFTWSSPKFCDQNVTIKIKNGITKPF